MAKKLNNIIPGLLKEKNGKDEVVRVKNVIGSASVEGEGLQSAKDRKTIKDYEAIQNFDIGQQKKVRDSIFQGIGTKNPYKPETMVFNETPEAEAAREIISNNQKKQAMVSEYNDAVNRQLEKALSNYTPQNENTIPSLAGTYANKILHPVQYDKAMNEIAPYLEQNGFTRDQLEKYYATQALREQNRQMQNVAAENPFANTMLSFATNQISNIETGANALNNWLSGAPLASNTVVNEYGKLTPIIRGTIREDIKNNADTKVGGAIGAGAYDVATGIGDQLMSLALTGGSKAGTLGLMSYGAGASNLNEQLGKDTSDAQKLATAVTSGVIEGLTEYLPLDNLFRLAKGGAGSTVRQIVFGVLGQMASEFGEEGVSEIANSIADNIINGAQSDYSQNVNAYMAQGLSQDEANKQAIKDVAGNAIYSAVIGGISGGIMGGGAITMNALGNRGNGNNNVQNNAVPALEQTQTEAPQAQQAQPLPALNRIGVEAESDAQRNAELANLIAQAQRMNEAQQAEDLEGSLNRQLAEAMAQDRATRLPDINGNWNIMNTLDYFDRQSNVAPDWTQREMTEEERNAQIAEMPVSDRIRNLIDPMPAWRNQQSAKTQAQFDGNIHEEAPTKQYNSEKIDGENLDSLNKDLKKLVNMFGTSETKALYGQINEAFNWWLQTGSKYAQTRVETLLTQLDNELKGHTYTYKKSYGKSKGAKTNPTVVYDNYAQKEWDVFEENLEDIGKIYNANKETRRSAQPAIPSVQTETQLHQNTQNDVVEQKNDKIEQKPAENVNNVPKAMEVNLDDMPKNEIEGDDPDIKKYNKSLDRTFGMYARGNYKGITSAEVINTADLFTQNINAYLRTGNRAYIEQALAAAGKLDKAMEGHVYITRRDGKKHTYEKNRLVNELNRNMATLERVANKNTATTQNEAVVQKPQTTQAEPIAQTPANNVDDSWARDLANAEAEAQYQQAQEQIPSVKKPKKSQKAQTQTELPSIKKNETVSNAPVAQTEQTQAVPQVEAQTQTQEQKPLTTIEPNGNPSITSQNTYQKSKAFSSKQAQEWLAQERKKGTYDVDHVSEKASMEKAAQRMAEDYEGEASRIESDTQLEGYQVDEVMIMLKQKIAEALRTGDWSEVKRFSAMVNQKIHKVAQSLQALAKHSRSAESAIMKVEQIVQSMTGNTANISNEDLTEVANIFKEAEQLGENSRARMELESQAYKILAKYIPNTTFMEKWNAFRYLAMLGNTRTHIRNILGNFMFGGVTNIKDAIAGTLEATLIQDESKRTKNVLNHASADMIKAASQDADNVWQELTDSGSNKYSMRNEIENEKKIFNSKALEGLRKLNEKLLTAEDNFALRNKYKRALASYLEAKGYDTSIFESENESDKKALDEARKYAIKQAKIATFHEESRAADMLNQWSKAALAKDSSVGQKALGVAIEAMVPFKKTPVNILKQGAIAYNPLQMFHGVYDAIANGDNPAKAIDEFSRGVTGSAIMALGYALASIGALRPSEKEDDDLDKLTGEQAYSINAGNKSYTIDWVAPAALPLFVGAELYKAFDDSADFDFWSALSSVSDPVIEMSMLQGLKNTIESAASYTSGKNTLGDTAINIGFGYGSQAVPTALGQVARAVDDTRRSTYTGKTGTSDTVMRNLKKIQNKIPGLSKLSEPYVDAWGETSENTGGSFLGRLAYNMLSPGYYADTSKTGTEEELYRLKELMDSGEIENHAIVPSVADKTYNKERLSPSDYTEISTQKGQNIQKLYTEAISNPKYQQMPDEKKAEVLSSLNKFGNALSKAEIFDYDIQGSDTYKKRYEAYEQGGVNGLIDWMMFKDTLEGQTSAAAAINALDNMDVSDEEKIAFFKSGRDYSKKAQYLDSIDPMYAYDWYKIKSTYGDKKSAIEYGILVSDLPDEEKQALMNVNAMKDAEVEYRLLIGQ